MWDVLSKKNEILGKEAVLLTKNDREIPVSVWAKIREDEKKKR